MQNCLKLELQDEEWPLDYIDHDRQIVRAIVVDDAGRFYFVRVCRDDDFGSGTFLETAGGGVEAGETLQEAIRRELREELGAEVEILCKLAEVSDYYHLIHRHNINHYFLCRLKALGETHLTQQEVLEFQLSIRTLTYPEAVGEYERCMDRKWGRLVARRELPVLHHAAELFRDILK